MLNIRKRLPFQLPLIFSGFVSVLPVFSSINYTSGAINTTEAFNVTVRVFTKTKSFTNDQPDGSCYGILVCDDDDIFNMYVKIQ